MNAKTTRLRSDAARLIIFRTPISNIQNLLDGDHIGIERRNEACDSLGIGPPVKTFAFVNVVSGNAGCGNSGSDARCTPEDGEAADEFPRKPRQRICDGGTIDYCDDENCPGWQG
jgi:hypothetical protein